MMHVFINIKKYFIDRKFRFCINANVLKLYKILSDKRYLELEYKTMCNKKLDLDNPITYGEKLQWLKLNDRKEIYTTMVDKYLAKELIANKIGAEFVIPILGVWNSFNEIDFDKLPNQFVLKCNHDSGTVIICKDKKHFDYKKAKKALNKSLKRDYYLVHREWPYKNIKRKIICEKFLEDDINDDGESWLVDYKFFCFNGVPKICYISRDRSSHPTTDFFDMEFNHLPFRMKDPNSKVLPKKPKCFDKMIELSKILSKGIPHLRVDFYFVNNHLYVGELTFYHCAGFVNIEPEEWNYTLGNWIDLPKVSK